MTLLWEQKASGSSSSPETDQSCLRCLKYLLLSECSSDSVDLWVKESQSLQDEDRKHKLSVIKAGTSLHRAESWTQISLCSSYIITNLCSAYLSAAVSPSPSSSMMMSSSPSSPSSFPPHHTFLTSHYFLVLQNKTFIFSDFHISQLLANTDIKQLK